MSFFPWFHRSFAVTLVALAMDLFLPSVGQSQSLEELYKLAVKEGGTLNFYATLAQINAEKILPVFEKRFPGIKVNHVDATSDKLVARAVTEARGGKTLGDVLQVPLENVSQAHDQKLLLEVTLPESAEYSQGMKGSFWVASDLQFIIAAWNTGLVKKEEEPKQYEDFADPRWKNRFIAEPRGCRSGGGLFDLLLPSLSQPHQEGCAGQLHAERGSGFDQCDRYFQERSTSEHGAFVRALGGQPGGTKGDGARRAHSRSP